MSEVVSADAVAIALAPNGTYDLAYTARQTAFLEQFRGSITYRESSIVLNVPLQAEASILLLPRSLVLGYNAGARRLTSDGNAPHAVTRSLETSMPSILAQWPRTM